MYLPSSFSMAAVALRAVGFNSTSNSTLVPSVNGLCGGNQTCLGSAFGQSCSQYGFCGSSSSFSGEGCLTAFGVCGVNATATASASSSTSVIFSYQPLTTSTSTNSISSGMACPVSTSASSNSTIPSMTASPFITPLPTSTPIVNRLMGWNTSLNIDQFCAIDPGFKNATSVN